jgi:lysozyme
MSDQERWLIFDRLSKNGDCTSAVWIGPQPIPGKQIGLNKKALRWVIDEVTQDGEPSHYMYYNGGLIHAPNNPRINRVQRLEMKTSEEGIRFIKNAEGFRDRMYLCSARKPTIGYGHVIRENEEFNDGITREEADKLFVVDLGPREKAVNELVKVSLLQCEFDALVSFVYNLGATALRDSTLLELLNKGDYDGAANQFPRWCKAGNPPKPIQGLILRREREKELFLRDRKSTVKKSKPESR